MFMLFNRLNKFYSSNMVLFFQKMKTAASLLNQEQLLVSPTSAFPSIRRPTLLLPLLMVMEMNTASAVRCQEHHHAGRAQVEADALN